MAKELTLEKMSEFYKTVSDVEPPSEMLLNVKLPISHLLNYAVVAGHKIVITDERGTFTVAFRKKKSR